MSTKIENGLIFNLYTPYSINVNGYSKISQVLTRRDELSPLYKYSRCLFLKNLGDYLTNDTNTYYILIVADGEKTNIETSSYYDVMYSIDSLKYIELVDKSVELGNNILNINFDIHMEPVDHLKVKGILLSPGETVQIPLWFYEEYDVGDVIEWNGCYILECGGIPYYSKTV